jgi:hypothetical protein
MIDMVKVHKLQPPSADCGQLNGHLPADRPYSDDADANF